MREIPKIKLFIRRLQGKPQLFSLEERLYNTIVLVAGIVSTAATIFNIIMGLNIELIVLTTSLVVFLVYMYYLIRIKRKYTLVGFLVPIVTTCIFAFLWFYNAGASGSISFLLLASMTAYILLTSRKYTSALIHFSIGVTFFLYIIEYHYPQLVTDYKSREMRYSDLVFTYIIIAYFMALFIVILKNEYIKQREKSIKQSKQLLEQSLYVNKVNIELLAKQKELSQAYNKMEYNISVAFQIQQSFLKSETALKNLFSDAFILLKPKEIISGDFYWFSEVENYKFLIAGDSTGHGVSAGFITVIGNDILNELILIRKLRSPAEILTNLQKRLVETLNISGNENYSYFGMDIGIVRFDKDTESACFAGAKNSLFLVRNKKLQVYKGARFGIGVWQSELNIEIPEIFFTIEKDDRIYMFSDGYHNQFGEAENKKLKLAIYKYDIIRSSNLSCKTQKKFLDLSLRNWQRNFEQNDDIMIIGVKV